jgi:anhydro-N-acetylmuramic acid kinase
MNQLSHFFDEIPVQFSSQYGINEDFKEAICFAVLANELLSGNKTSIPTVSGSDQPVFLGKICPV